MFHCALTKVKFGENGTLWDHNLFLVHSIEVRRIAKFEISLMKGQKLDDKTRLHIGMRLFVEVMW